MLHNFIRVQQLVDPILEDQDAAFLASIDEEILSQSTMEEIPNNSQDNITCVHVSDEWTTFRDTLALQMFHDYQAQRGYVNPL